MTLLASRNRRRVSGGRTTATPPSGFLIDPTKHLLAKTLPSKLPTGQFADAGLNTQSLDSVALVSTTESEEPYDGHYCYDDD